jgi:hypothetical protein
LLTHLKVNTHNDGTDSTKTQPSDWNAEHVFGGGLHGALLYRDTGVVAGANWLTPGAVGYALLSNGVGSLPSYQAVANTATLMKLADGTASAPSLAFAAETTLGLYRSAAGKLSIGNNGGTVDLTGQSTGMVLTSGTTPSWTTSPTLTSLTLTTLSIANAGNSSITNGGGTLDFTPQGQAGWRMSSLLRPLDDNLQDLGSTSNRIHIGYFGTALAVGTNPATVGVVRVPTNTFFYSRDVGNTADLELIGSSVDVTYVGSSGTAKTVLRGGSTGAFVGYGGTSASFPALKRNAARLQGRLADDSANTGFDALDFTATSFVAVGTTPAATGDWRAQKTFTFNWRDNGGTDRNALSTSGTNSDELVVGDVNKPTRLNTNMAAPSTLANGNWWVESDTGAVTGTVGRLKVRLNGATVTVADSSAGSGVITLLIAGSGTDTNAAATNVATVAISGLTAKDRLLVFYEIESATQTTSTPYLYNSTDAVIISELASIGLNLGAGIQAQGDVQVQQRQSGATAISARTVIARSDGLGGKAELRQSAFTTNWTGSWTLALRHGGVTAGGTFSYVWAVYKVAGQ